MANGELFNLERPALWRATSVIVGSHSGHDQRRRIVVLASTKSCIPYRRGRDKANSLTAQAISCYGVFDFGSHQACNSLQLSFFSPCCFPLVALLVAVRVRGYRLLKRSLDLLLELLSDEEVVSSVGYYDRQ
jgi:hypothetical protein